jgi:hypothetical protein
MEIDTRRVIAVSLFLVIQTTAGVAYAQVGNMLKGALGGSGQTDSGSGGGVLGSGLSPSSLSAGSTGNAAGVLQYCIQNNYLSGDSASSVKDQLVGKVSGGGSPSSASGYTDGAKGILTSGSGQKVDLGGSGLKAQATKQVCAKILDQAKALL